MSEYEKTTEFTQELASNEPQKPTKKGYLDTYNSCGEQVIRAASGVFAPLTILSGAVGVYGPEGVLPGLITTGLSMGYFFKEEYQRGKSVEGAAKVVEEINLRFRKVVYTGQESIHSNGVELNNGDEVLYVYLPRFQKSAEGSSQTQAKIDDKTWELYQYALDVIKENIADDPNFQFKAVCFDLNSADPVLTIALKFTDTVKRKQLFEGKQLVFKKPEAKAVLVGVNELKEFNFVPSIMFKEAATILGAPQLNALLRDAAKCETEEECQAFKAAIEEVVKKIVFNQLVSFYNGPEVIRNKDLMSNPNLRLRQNTVVEMGSRSGGLTYRKLVTDTGEVSEQMVEKLLGLTPTLSQESPRVKYQDARRQQSARGDSQNGEWPAWSFQKKSPLQKAKAAYYMYWALQIFSFKQLIDKPYNVSDLLDFIDKHPLNIDQENGDTRKLLDQKRTELKRLINFPKHVLPAVLSFGLFLSALQGERWIKDHVDLSQLAQNLSSGQVDNHINIASSRHQDISAGLEDDINARFPNGQLPGHSLDWKVTSSGQISTDGYYILNTSNSMNDGSPTWRVNMTVKASVPAANFPKVPGGTNYIDLKKRVSVGEHDVIVKLPIKNDTTIGAVKVSEEGKELKNYSVVYFEDGTAALDLSHEGDGSHVEDIDVYLVPGDTPVHATSKVAPINEKKLSPEAEDLIEKAYKDTHGSDSGYHQEITDLVKASHKYSLTSSLQDEINSAKTREETINLSQESLTCDCVICNAESVLLASAVDGTAVNLADGYLHQEEGGYLDGSTSHAFGIDSKGKLLDSTPSELANPNEKVAPDAVKNIDREWQDMLDKVQKESQLPFFLTAGAKTLAETLAVFGGVFFGIKKISGIYKRVSYEKKRKQIAEEILKREKFIKDLETGLLEELTDEEWSKARDFMNWLSYGGDTTYNPGLVRDSLSKDEVLAAIKKEANQQKVTKYFIDPETSAKMFSAAEQVKFRKLALALPLIG